MKVLWIGPLGVMGLAAAAEEFGAKWEVAAAACGLGRRGTDFAACEAAAPAHMCGDVTGLITAKTESLRGIASTLGCGSR